MEHVPIFFFSLILLDHQT